MKQKLCINHSKLPWISWRIRVLKCHSLYITICVCEQDKKVILFRTEAVVLFAGGRGKEEKDARFGGEGKMRADPTWC